VLRGSKCGESLGGVEIVYCLLQAAKKEGAMGSRQELHQMNWGKQARRLLVAHAGPVSSAAVIGDGWQGGWRREVGRGTNRTI
jgi:hypothetical protein